MKKIIIPSIVLIFVFSAILACEIGGARVAVTESIRADDGGSITTRDGALTLEIPPGALSEDTRISIQSADPEDVPDEFANLGSGPVYELSPPGLTFSEPVTVSFSLDPASVEVGSGDGYEIYYILSWSEEFGSQPLDELVLEVSRSDGTATLQAEMDHFSYLTWSKSGMSLSLEEVPREQPVGGSFTARVEIENIESTAEYPTLVAAYLGDISGRFSAVLQVELVGSGEFTAPHAIGMNFEPFTHDGNFRCATTPGEGTYGVGVSAVMSFVWDEGAENLRWHDLPISMWLESDIECVAPLPGTQPPVTTGDAVEQLLGTMGYTPEQITQLRIARVFDPSGDWIYSILGITPGQLRGYLDFLWWSGFLSETDLAALEFWFNLSLFECGETSPEGWLTVCSYTAGDFPEGNMLVFAAMFDGDIPLDDPNAFYTYAVVMDSDGDPSNNFEFMPPYDWDYYQGTDRWYELVWDPTMGAWELYLVGENFAEIHTDARAVIAENAVIFFIPASEVAVERPAFRMTAFGHDGTYAPEASGGDVTGDNPAQPLSEITGDTLLAP